MGFAQRRANPARLAVLLLIGFGGVFPLGLPRRFGWFALHDQRHCPHHGLILAIGDVISHGLLHEVPSLLVPETNIVLDRSRTLRGERHSISDRGDRNQWARMLREAGLAGPGFVELPASNAAPFTEPNAERGRSERARLHNEVAKAATSTSLVASRGVSQLFSGAGSGFSLDLWMAISTTCRGVPSGGTNSVWAPVRTNPTLV